MKRSSFIFSSLGSVALMASGCTSYERAETAPVHKPAYRLPPLKELDLRKKVGGAVVCNRIEVLRNGKYEMLRVRSSNGDGLIPINNRFMPSLSLFQELVAPFFLQKDLTQLPQLIDAVYRSERNYKFVGMPFWNAVAHVELAALDLLGKLLNSPVHALFGQAKRTEVDVYVTTFNRESSPEETIEECIKKIEKTNAQALKIKIGGRMSLNKDSLPGRTNALIPAMREAFPNLALMADSNGSYDFDEGLRVGQLLEEHKYTFYEEPCEWEDFATTKALAEALTIPIAGGEQDSSLYKIAWMIHEGAVDIIQTDLMYCGGFLRSYQVAEMAKQKGIPFIPHSPRRGPLEAYKLHMGALLDQEPFYMEHNPKTAMEEIASPVFSIEQGKVRVPGNPGWGVEYDEPWLQKASEILVYE